MTHLPHLIQDLGFILVTAAIVTLLFRRMGQPVVLGYLIAGFLLGPNFPLFPSVQDRANITIWAEIGVIFMLFGLGLEFSFKKLTKVGKSAGITALFEIGSMLGIGYILGQILGWNKMDSLFLGGILSISSTTIIVRAFDELGLKTRNFVSLVFGVLIIEDVIAILLLVLLSSVAVTQSLSGSELVTSSIRLTFFLLLWFILGIYLLPAFLKKFRSYLTDETTLVVSIGLCLMMVIVASHVGFSPALGAFVMGSILAETRDGHRIERLLMPVKDLFSAVFFVSVGMLIDFAVLREFMSEILIITAVTVFGKLLSSFLGALISGRSLKNSIQAGMSLAQIGEFSFIIATLGMTLKVTSHFLYPIAVAVSAITTFLTPYMIKNADAVYGWVEARIPNNIKNILIRYESTMSTESSAGIFSLIWKEYGIKIVLNSVIVVAIALAMQKVVLSKIAPIFGNTDAADTFVFLVTILFSAPFLWAIFNGKSSHTSTLSATQILELQKLQIGIVVVRFIIGSILAAFIVSQFTSILAFSGVILVVLAAIAAFFFSRYSEPIYQKMESRFLSNLTDKERQELRKNNSPVLAPWDATLLELVLTSSSPLVGKTLIESKLKENYGITIAMIDRAGNKIIAPRKDFQLLPNDKLFLIGNEQQLTDAQKIIVTPIIDSAEAVDNFKLTSLKILPTHSFANQAIRTCGLREAVDGLIVGIERNGERILSPDSSMILVPNDLVWIVGDITKINLIKS